MEKNWLSKFKNLLSSHKKIDEDFYEELEETLILSDFGVKTSNIIMDELRIRCKKEKVEDTSKVLEIIKSIIMELVESNSFTENFKAGELKVVLIIGVNGVGKTTSMAKYGNMLKNSGLKVMFGAADTFRAGAIEQLCTWGDRLDIPVVKSQSGADPASVIYDSISRAKNEGVDVLLIDTAGRLHNKENLMKEMKKIHCTILKLVDESALLKILVLDGSTGQNAFVQGEEFSKSVDGINSFMITKLDGSAKGGVLVSIINQLKIPISYYGNGEKIEDLHVFDPQGFVNNIFKE